MNRTIAMVPAALAFAAGAASPVLAHVSLETKQAGIGATYKAVFGVPHGCNGSPTVEVRIDIPEGVIGVKPMPKAGWRLSTVKGPYERSYKHFHGPLSEGVKQVTWSGGELLDEHFDQFVLSTYIARELEPGAQLHFPVTQKCVEGELNWNEIPAAGQDAHALDHPAPGLLLVAGKMAQAHDHHGHVGHGDTAASSGIAVTGAWTRPVASAGGVGAGYLAIANRGNEADVLVGGSTDVAERLEIHETSIDDKGVASMKKVDRLDIAPGKSVELKPGGLHIMLIGLKAPLKEGGAVGIKLEFEKAGEIDVELPVRAGGAPVDDHQHHHH